jgi:hypothetical protein
MNPHDDSSADDLRPVIDLLRASRPEATALELDSVKQQVRRRAAGAPAGRRARSATLMKSRIAILSMLVAGMLLSTTGAGLAVSGISGNAAVEQYQPGGGDQGDQGGTPNKGMNDNGGTLGENDAGNGPATPSTTAAQPTRQLETGATGSTLPFTGFLAIPVLLGGIALLTTGLVLRRRTDGQRN